MHVANLLASKGHEVATVAPSQSVSEAVALLKERGIGALVVTGSTPPLVGIFSERDVVRALASRGASVLNDTVADLMSTDVTTCDESTLVNELMTMMTDRRIRHVPVVDHGVLTGMISIGDVVKARLEELEHEKKDLLDYVSAR
ncbi:MAG: CBS domain-containing protein [Acidobacteriota bacterium]|nr:CBS domain-containing protein [Acidobacteriota bacterium]MDE3107562.1 CBS domain-containing protein [Acidobacteriota bacterium]